MHLAPVLVHVIGMTNAGKSTLLDAFRHEPRAGFVEVGKILRAKYPPDYFKGQNNPAHTAEEAWNLYLEGIAAATAAGKRLVFIDGQPRDKARTDALCADQDGRARRVFVHLWAPDDVLRARAQRRDGADPARLQLSLDRIASDKASNYSTVMALLAAGEAVALADTSAPGYDPRALVSAALNQRDFVLSGLLG